MAEPTTPPDVGQQLRRDTARKLLDLARPLLDEAARLLEMDPHPDKET